MPSIEELRKAIDEIDGGLVLLLRRRIGVALEIGKYKRGMGLPVYDPSREEAVLEGAAERARSCGLNPDLYKEVQRAIIRLCRSAEEGERGQESV